MAITKERLKKLIEQGATVYSKYYSYKLNSKNSGLRVTYDVFDSKEYLLIGFFSVALENLYEHKADAEWELEFGNVEKRIKFVKPKPFREIENEKDYTYDAHGFRMYIYSGLISVYEVDYNHTGSSIIFDKPFNEENYTEACRLIKKL